MGFAATFLVPLAAAVNINGRGTYLHWSILTIALANLVLIGVMLLIFALALTLPFPGGSPQEQPAGPAPRPGTGAPPQATSWTGRLRTIGVRWLPPERLLPETQPAYVASWIYVFGVASLAALAVAILSGLLIALGGVDWWHTNSAGHFFNSLHLWSVEFFMALLVIHLWGKFFMAAWRGRRGRVWITGVLAFLVSIIEALTGYLSQQNFDSQWIATNGKDAFNAVGVGGFFNLMDFGQMLLWHIVLFPLVLIAIVVIHILLVRYRGVVHPFAPRRGRDLVGRLARQRPGLSRREVKEAERSEWRGPVRRYDLVREAVAATAVILAATLALAFILSSPDVRPITIRQWATANPGDFVTTAASELAGTSETATYGPPYNHASGSVQRIGVSWQRIAGVLDATDAARSFVIDPLQATSAHDPALRAALHTWTSTPAGMRSRWASAYAAAAARKLAFSPNGTPVVAPGDYGPVPTLIAAELSLARQGGLEASLIARHSFYGTDFTRPLLFLEDGSYFSDRAQAQRLLGDQWGVMNETGGYPGQPWLWLYQLWYHVPGFDTSANVDLIAIYLTGAATLLLLLIPFIPGLRDIPRLLPLHRQIWRRYYRDAESTAAPPTRPGPPATGS